MMRTHTLKQANTPETVSELIPGIKQKPKASQGIVVVDIHDVVPYLPEKKIDKSAGNSVKSSMDQREDSTATAVSDFKKSSTGVADLAEDAASLVAERIPAATQDDITKLTKLIEEAKTNPPNGLEAKQQFVNHVNRMLDVWNLRIQNKQGDLCRLTARPGANNRGYIQFSGSRGITGGGLRGASIRLVPIQNKCGGKKHQIVLAV